MRAAWRVTRSRTLLRDAAQPRPPRHSTPGRTGSRPDVHLEKRQRDDPYVTPRTIAGGPFTHGIGEASARRSVSRVLSRGLAASGDGHPSRAVGCPTAHAADPRAGQRTSPPPTVARPRVAPSYLALLQVEFARFTPSDGSRRRPASSLWHWSSPHGGRALPATLRWGARTFLTPPAGCPTGDARPSDRLADRPESTPLPRQACPQPNEPR